MRSFLFFSSLVLITACVEDVGTGKTAAVIEDVPTADPAAPAAGVALTVDASQGKVHALGAKVTATHPIDFKDYSGTITLDGDAITAVSYEIQMATLESDHPKLTTHLKDEDFFDVPNHPTSTFQSTEVVAKSGDAGATHVIKGDLTIRGNTKRVSFPAKVELTPELAKASTEFVIDRRDFKVIYPGRKDDLVQDNVVLTVELVAPRQ